MFTNMPIKLLRIEKKNEAEAVMVVGELGCINPAEMMRNRQQVAAGGTLTAHDGW